MGWLGNFFQDVVTANTTANEKNLKNILCVSALWGADFTKQPVNLEYAKLDGVDLRGSNFTGKSLMRASLAGADLREAKLNGAFLRGADLRGAKLDGADLTGADLSAYGNLKTGRHVTQITIEQLAKARIDATTTLPQGITLEAIQRVRDAQPAAKGSAPNPAL